MKKSKKFVLVGFVLLAITMVLLPLAGCKTEVDTNSPQQEQTGENAGTGDNDSNGTSDNPSADNGDSTGGNAGTEDNTSGGGDSGTGGEGSGDNPSAGNDGDTGSDETEIGDFGSPFGSGWNNETDLQ